MTPQSSHLLSTLHLLFPLLSRNLPLLLGIHLWLASPLPSHLQLGTCSTSPENVVPISYLICYTLLLLKHGLCLGMVQLPSVLAVDAKYLVTRYKDAFAGGTNKHLQQNNPD